MGEQHPHQDHIHEEPLSRRLGLGQLPMREVPRDDARIVRQVPRPCGRRVEEAHPPGHGRSRRDTATVLNEQLRLDGVAKQVFIDGPPPRAACNCGVWRVENSSRLLPTHERDDRPPVRPVPPPPAVQRIRVGGQANPALGVVAHLGDHPCRVALGCPDRGDHRVTASDGRSIRPLKNVAIQPGVIRPMLAINQFRHPGTATGRPRSRARRPAAATGSGDARCW